MLPGLASDAAPRGFSEEASGAPRRAVRGAARADRRASADDGGLLLTIEDLHWADRSTRAFLTYLAASLVSEKVLVVATYRPDELHRRHPLRPLLAELERARAAASTLRAVHPRRSWPSSWPTSSAPAPDADLVERLWARSEGNALYAEELLAAGMDGRGALPPTLREALMVRIERLAPATQEVLRMLADRRARRARRARRGDAARRRRCARRCATASPPRSSRVDNDGRYGFRHALLGEVIADDLLPGERAELHLALARALESHTAPGAHNASAIAHHYSAAGDQPRALEAPSAPARPPRPSAPTARPPRSTSARWSCGTACRTPRSWPATDRVDLLRAAAWCQHTEGDSERAEALLRAARGRGRRARRTRCAWPQVLERLARQQWRPGRPDEARGDAASARWRCTPERAGHRASAPRCSPPRPST